MSDAEKHKYTMGNAEKGGVPARIGKEDGVQDDVSLSEAGSHTCVPPPCPPSRSPCPSSFLKRGRSTENVPFPVFEKSFRRSARQKRDSKLKLMVPGSGALEVGEKQDTESAHGDSRTLSCRAPGSPADALDGFCL